MIKHEVFDVSGSKGGGGSAHTPVESPDDLHSLAKTRMLVALSNGPVRGGLTNQRILLNGTPIAAADGTMNFPGVRWEFRDGSAHQDIIKGFPAIERPHTVGTKLEYGTPWVQEITNLNLDAVRLRLGFPYMADTKDNGDTVGTRVDYKIELAVDGAGFQTVMTLAAVGKTTSLYERDHRIDLPRATTRWQIRVTRLTADSSSQRLQNSTQIQGWTEIVDSRLRYPFTALLYIEFDAKSFPNIPQVSCVLDGVLVDVPSNYDPDARTYSGSWDGTFKQAWTCNPAWVMWAMCTNELFGLGKRIKPNMINKWDIYRIGQRCDERVPDGKGGTECRFTFHGYFQGQSNAWDVLRDIAATFNGKAFWGNSVMNIVSDMPGDVKQIVTRANVVGGKFNYAGGSQKNRYSQITVGMDDPTNHYNSKAISVVDLALQLRYGMNQTQITAIGCTSEGEAQRRGKYVLLTNMLDRGCSIQMGLDGIQFVPGNIIALADERVSGKVMGGRLSAPNTTTTIITDRLTDAQIGDAILVRTKDGQPERRTISRINGVEITVSPAFSVAPADGAVFVIDSGQLKLQLYRVQSMRHVDGEDKFDIQLTIHNDSKYDAIDRGAKLDVPNISLLPVPGLAPPDNIAISSYDQVVQGQRIKTMRVTWDKVDNALQYEAQWRRDSNDWINIPASSARSFEVPDIFSGTYSVRVRSIGLNQVSSAWGNATPTDLTGRVGDVPAPIGLKGTPMLYGIQWAWAFGPDSDDLLQTELEYKVGEDNTVRDLSNVPYPTREYQQMGLSPGQVVQVRGRCIDKMGNQSVWTDWVEAQSNGNADDYLKGIADDFLSAEDGKALKEAMQETLAGILSNAAANSASVHQQYKQHGQAMATILQVSTTIADVKQSFAEFQTVVNASFADNEAQVNQKLTASVDADSASAMYALGLKVLFGGKEYNAGMSLGVIPDGNGSYKTRVGFVADEFVLLTGPDGNQVSPWAVKGSTVYLSNTVIENATIDRTKIVTQLSSANWTGPGGNGWMIDSESGTAYFNNARIRGTIYATDGEFAGKISATSGTLDNVTINDTCVVLGRLKASQIDGPLMQTALFFFNQSNTNAQNSVIWDGSAGRGDVPMTIYILATRDVNNQQGAAGVWVDGVRQAAADTSSANFPGARYVIRKDVGTGGCTMEFRAGALNQGQGEYSRWTVQVFAAPTANSFRAT